MRKVFSAVAAGLLFFGQANLAGADTKTFTISATIPVATSVGINAFRYNAADNTRTSVSGNALSFDPMTFNAANQIYLLTEGISCGGPFYFTDSPRLGLSGWAGTAAGAAALESGAVHKTMKPAACSWFSAAPNAQDNHCGEQACGHP